MKNLNKILLFLLLLPMCVCASAQSPVMNNSNKEWALTFEDNFDGDDLDWNVWSSDDSKYLKNDTHRDKYCVQVKDGELRLYVKKESHNASTWRAASIFQNEVLENNSYVECRFRSTQCSGVNNAFWMANRTSQPETYQNKYEIDIVEARMNVETQNGDGHVAWHDWKTYGYTKNEQGANFDIAQGANIEHDFAKYHTWGLWYGENEIIIYLDGEPVWNGKTSQTYPDQWWTGVGKAKTWNPIEEKRAYGNFGQNDWSYRAGYNGDKLNVMLSTLPWGEGFTPLTDEAHDTYMAVDYVRIFKPKSELRETPVELVDKVAKAILFGEAYSLAQDTTIYFSVIAESTSNSPFDLHFMDANGGRAFALGIDQYSDLWVSINDQKSSTKTAYPASEQKRVPFAIGGRYLLVGRITAHKGQEKYDKDAISFSVFDMNRPPIKHEPYFYPNIDIAGNTSITNGWQINAKDFSDAVLKSVQIQGNWNVSQFRTGYNYRSVLPSSWHGAVAQLSGCEMVQSSKNSAFDISLSGKAPFSIAYTVNGERKEVSGIDSEKYALSLKPKENTIIELTEVKDGEGKSGAVYGQAYVVAGNKKQNAITPMFDTYVQTRKDADFSNYQYFEMKGDRRYEREIFISFDLSTMPNVTDRALLFLYCADNQNKQPIEMDVFAIQSDKSPFVAHLTDVHPSQLAHINKIKVSAEADKYVGCDLGNTISQHIAEGRKNLILKIKFAGGDETNMIKFIQGHGKTSEKGPKLVFIK